jgi:hypothetical protein
VSATEARAPGARRARQQLPALVIILAALCLHGYEQAFENATGFSPGWFLWSMMPYGICLAGLAIAADTLPLAAAAAVALSFDALAFDAVFIHPTRSTAPLVLIFAPLWNALLFVPGAILATWLLMRWMKRA